MRFLLDESVDARLRQLLSADGHDVTTIITEHQLGLPDLEVLAIAYAEERVLITHDRDFGELIVRQRLPHRGVVLLRLQSVALMQTAASIRTLIRDYADQFDQLLVLTERGVRIRNTRG